MTPSGAPQLSRRQREILRGVVEEYVATGEPVGSKTLVERSGLQVSPSTVRAELAELEAQGVLTHPHTSAGRLPTEEGYRYYASELLTEPEPRPAGLGIGLAAPREVDSALQQTT
jgi:heat-inducible transcriptional repressor